MYIAMLFVFAAVAALTPTMMRAIQQSTAVTIGTVTAGQLHQVEKAAKGYISAYATNLEGVATASSPAQVTIPMLVSTGFLPSGFQATDPYGQTYEVEVLQPTAGNLQALVLTTGGQAIKPADAGRIASESGAEGGVVENDGYAHGSYGGWLVSMTGYPNPGTGHLAALIDYNQGTMQSDYLYRTAVSGQPQLNQMQTNLDMGNNDVNNAKDVNVNDHVTIGTANNPTGGSTATQTGQLGVDEPAGDGWPSGWGGGIRTFDLFANGTVAAGTNGSPKAYLDSSGLVYAGDQAELGTSNGTATSGAGCSPNGSIAANANGSGQLLTCQGGAWTTPGYTPFVSYHKYQMNNINATWYVGWWRICVVNGRSNTGGGYVQAYPISGTNAADQRQWDVAESGSGVQMFDCFN